MTGLNHVGFISSNFDNPKEMTSEIHFIGSIDQYLISLHMQYMKHRRQFKHHPYYFINEIGNPLTLTSVINVIKRKCKRLGLESVAEGISTQGLKHFYGYYSSHVLKLDKIIVQKLMGYAEISAVEKYHTNYNNVFKEIDKQKRIKHE
jgi:site-specific recombinase XerD